jgi:hypothetical protein
MSANVGQHLLSPNDWDMLIVPMTGISNATPGSHVITTGSPNRATVEDFRFNLSDNNNDGHMDIGGVWLIPRSAVFPSGAISVTFDDSRPSALNIAAPIMTARDIRGTMFGYTGLLGTGVGVGGGETVMTFEQNDRLLREHGWEFQFHAHDSTATYASQSSKQLDRRFVQGKAFIEHQLHRPDSEGCAYVSGEFHTFGSRNALPDIRRRFQWGRTIFDRWGVALPPPHFYKLSARSVQSSETASDINTWIDTVIAEDGWAILSFHSILDSGAADNSVLTSTFTSIMDHIETLAGSGTVVAPMGEIYEQLT